MKNHPFKAIQDTRPWPRLDMTTERWLRQPVRWIHFGELIRVQRGVYIDALFRSAINRRNVFVVRWYDQYYLEDGHTRVTRQALQRMPGTYAHILEVEDWCPTQTVVRRTL